MEDEELEKRELELKKRKQLESMEKKGLQCSSVFWGLKQVSTQHNMNFIT